MAKFSKKTKETSDKKVVRVIRKMINDIMEGKTEGKFEMPWHKLASTGMPVNSKNVRYKGINVLSLWLASYCEGFSSNIWFTYGNAQEIRTDEPRRLATEEEKETYFKLFKGTNFYKFNVYNDNNSTMKTEVAELGVTPIKIGNKRFIPSTKIARGDTLEVETFAHVKKGESSKVSVLFTKPRSKTEIDPETGDEVTTFFKPIYKHYAVFNADQIEGLPEGLRSEKKEFPKLTGRLPLADNFIADTGANIRFGGSRACYIPSVDRIELPVFEDFKTVNGYYSTALHELIHWTGAKTRKDRKLDSIGKFGGKGYAIEELIAEMGSAMAMCRLGITATPRTDHAQYMNSWLKALNEDDSFILKASAKAQEGVDYLEEVVNTPKTVTLKEVA